MPESQIQVRLNPDVLPSGSDLAVVNAARRSFNTRSEWDADGSLKDKDRRLLEFLARGMTAEDFDKFLETIDDACLRDDMGEGVGDLLPRRLWEWRNTPTHDTPYNHCFISFEIKAPIFVRAQLVKHEYLIMSEFSRRYITDDIEFYTPDTWRKAAEDKKQGSSSEAVDLSNCSAWGGPFKGNFAEGTLLEDCGNLEEEALSHYKMLLEAGVAPEQARMVLPQSVLTEWTWSGTLGAFAKMCTLRIHPEAQYEARLVANQVYDYLKEYYPVGAKALVEGV